MNHDKMVKYIALLCLISVLSEKRFHAFVI